MTTETLRLPLPTTSQRSSVWKERFSSPTFWSTAVLSVLITLAVLADWVRPHDSQSVDFASALLAPSWANPFGTDEVGRDLLARVIHGLRISFAVSLMAAVMAATIGGILGILAGAFGGWVDSLIMRTVDLFASMNHLLFGILLVVLFRPMLGPAGALLLSVGLTHWIGIARIVRGELLSLRERPFVSAAVNAGAGQAWLARQHYLPHMLPAAGLGLILLVPHAIFHESALSFLGLGLPPHMASLGNILSDARRSLLAGAWWPSLFPGLMIFVVVLCIGTLGDYMRDRLNPRWRSELEL